MQRRSAAQKKVVLAAIGFKFQPETKWKLLANSVFLAG
jgi:hypothetical protein